MVKGTAALAWHWHGLHRGHLVPVNPESLLSPLPKAPATVFMGQPAGQQVGRLPPTGTSQRLDRSVWEKGVNPGINCQFPQASWTPMASTGQLPTPQENHRRHLPPLLPSGALSKGQELGEQRGTRLLPLFTFSSALAP